MAVSRDHRKLRVFQIADGVIADIYCASNGFPTDEKYGLTSQLRRAAVSVASNIVEGSARRTTREYVNFLNHAHGSAAEARYLLTVAHRLDYLPEPEFVSLSQQYADIARGLQAMIRTLTSRD